MKKFYAIALCFVFAACNNDSEKGTKIGDTLRLDPQTGQPITINRDTVPVAADSTGR